MNTNEKLREALEEIVANIEMRSNVIGLNTMVDTKTFINAKDALAIPRRNCDVFAHDKLVSSFCKFMNYDEMDPKNGFADGLNEFMREHWFTFALWITQEYKEPTKKEKQDEQL